MALFLTNRRHTPFLSTAGVMLPSAGVWDIPKSSLFLKYIVCISNWHLPGKAGSHDIVICSIAKQLLSRIRP